MHRISRRASSRSCLRCRRECRHAVRSLKTEEQKTFYALGLALSQSLAPVQPQRGRAGAGEVGPHRRRAESAAEGRSARLRPQAPGAAGVAPGRPTASVEKKLGQTFLDKAAAEKGATKTPSGVIVTTIKPGTGALARGQRQGQGALHRHPDRRDRLRQLRAAWTTGHLPAQRRDQVLDGRRRHHEGRRQGQARLPGRRRLRRQGHAAPRSSRAPPWSSRWSCWRS